ncbi:CopG family ribbon-helix-helix protein [Vampirovibrio chlorellavorus]|uniref:CopG family ribbon-helix-helix protein n=1 Tax=Vampirovibrio chlorellavorus TaxID=758823 RepID=UPI0026F2D1B7|nr:ribbon-helix-helix protein, CopG family [Vampirovibrio chlorellavorus]
MARVLISMKDEFLRRIDEVAEKEQRSRSELIREALRTYIRKNASASQSAQTVGGSAPVEP